jgi:hypothetical protein
METEEEAPMPVDQEVVDEQVALREKILAEKKKKNSMEPPKPKFVKPYEKDNIHMSRDEYEKDQRAKAEKRAKVAAYEKSLENSDDITTAADADKKKSVGRPKKILD